MANSLKYLSLTSPFRACLLVLVCMVCLGPTPPRVANAAEQAMPPMLVRTFTVQARDVVPVFDYIGKTSGSLAVLLRAQVEGTLKKRYFKEGDYVQKGQVLFEIAPETYKAKADQAKAQVDYTEAVLDNASREWVRVKALFAQNAVSTRDRDSAHAKLNSAKASYEAAKAELTEANIKLDYAFVKAPVSGHASKERVTEGNVVSTVGDDSILTEINQTDPVFVEFSLPNTDMLKLRQLVTRGFATWGDKPEARIRFADGSTYDHVGELNFVDNKVDPVTSVIRARCSFPNPDNLVLPGQFVRVAISGPVLTNAKTIPRAAVLQTQKGTMVMVVTDKGTVQSRPVKILLPHGEDYVLEEGLEAGEKIVTEGVGKIRDGQAVREADAGQAGGK